MNLATQKLAVCLGESNYYGSIFTVKHLVQQGKADGALRGGAGIRAVVFNSLVWQRASAQATMATRAA